MVTLVTGGAGFIGSDIAAALLARGDAVVVLDDLSSGRRADLPPGADLVEADIADPSTNVLIRDIGPSVIVHAAAQVSVERSMREPFHDRRVNLEGTANVLGGAISADVRRIVFVSSGGAIYGDTASATESSLPRPATYYGVHKFAAERYVELSGVPYAIARLANVYGPGQRSGLEGGVVAIFAEHAASGLPLPIHGTGRQARDFVHVDDIVRALLKMVDTEVSGVWNIGTGRLTSINQLAKIIDAAHGSYLGRRIEPARTADVSRSSLVSLKAQTDLQWQPAVSLESGILRTLRTVK